MTLKIFSIVSVLIASIGPWASIKLYAMDSYEQSFNIAVKLLKEDLSVDVKTLQRPVSIYNWGGLPPFALNQTPAPDAPAWQQYLSQADQLPSDFFLNYDNSDEMGTGMYFAGDPLKSQIYGDVLYVATIAKGTRFLDTRYRRDDYQLIRRETFLSLQNICPEIDYRSHPSDKNFLLLKKEHFQRYPKCRHIFNQTLSELGVQFYAFHWKVSERFGVCKPDGFREDPDVSGYVLGGRVTLNSKEEDDVTIDLNSINFKVYPLTLFENKTTEQVKALIESGDKNTYDSYYIDFLARFQNAEGRTDRISKSKGLWKVFDGLYPFMEDRLIKQMKASQMNCGDLFEEDIIREANF